MVTDLSDISPDGNWCPDCGEPFGVCICITQDPRILQIAEDMSEASRMLGRTIEDAVQEIRLALADEAPMIRALIEGTQKWIIDNMSKKERKLNRRARRHYFLTHGKHGLKRPRGKRKVSA